MTPEAKANELLEKFHQCMYAVVGNTDKGPIYSYTDRSKACALICVEEILALKLWGKSNGVTDTQYWQEVKTHLINS